MESSSFDQSRGVPTHGGRYIQYNVYGNLFEVPRKYTPPIRPVGRGAYGIVWYEASLLYFFLFLLLAILCSPLCKTWEFWRFFMKLFNSFEIMGLTCAA